MIPAMERQGYRRDFACAVVIAASLCGPLIPPSIPMLVYGISSGSSIGALFLAGATPGVAVGLALMVLNRIMLRRMPVAEPGIRLLSFQGLRRFLVNCRVALVALAMPLIIVGGIIGGVVTPTESSVAAVLYAMAVGLSMRTVHLRALWSLFAKTTAVSATIMLIIGTANLLGWVLTFERIPQLVTGLFLSTSSSTLFIAFVVVLLLVVGLFLETSGSIIILTPILLPTANALGIDPIHFGVIMVFGLVIGLLTPPVGLCLFVGCSVAQLPLHVLSRAVLPQVVVLIGVYLVFAFWPDASLWLPHLFFKGG
jgi:C4-dicarboxylate transporter DctM subunit